MIFSSYFDQKIFTEPEWSRVLSRQVTFLLGVDVLALLLLFLLVFHNFFLDVESHFHKVFSVLLLTVNQFLNHFTTNTTFLCFWKLGVNTSTWKNRSENSFSCRKSEKPSFRQSSPQDTNCLIIPNPVAGLGVLP